ncbi:MAG: DUF2339 domain-containing protein [Chakrabartia sp.]
MFVLLLIILIVGGISFKNLKNRSRNLEQRFDVIIDRIAALERASSGTVMEEKEATPASVMVAEPAPEPVAEPIAAPIIPVPPEPLTIEAPISDETPKVPAMAQSTPRGPARIIYNIPEEQTVTLEPVHEEEVEGIAPVIAEEPPAPPENSQEKPQRNFAASFEALVGGKLPIWIGGVSLVLAAVFLVRYSLEQGWFGPAVRSVLAGIFGVALLVASEAARRVPRFAADERVAQVLAGAGIASLYGTLYMAGELYNLITPLTSFVLMVIVTAAALMLSLRHGPPTAIMGLVGGFVAPFMAAPSGNLVPLLIYLGLLIAGLFAVAIHRGWTWLAMAATGGGILWTLGIMAAKLTGIGPSLGLFIVVIALGATILFPRSGAGGSRVRLIPMVAGFIQLALFAPTLNFALSGWLLYGLLSLSCLYLGWRDARLMPANLAALGLVLILLVGAFGKGSALAPMAALGATLLFAIPGHIFARRSDTGRSWALLALGGGMGPLLVAILSGGYPLLNTTDWARLFVLAALPAAVLSWRARDEGRATGSTDSALTGGALVAAAAIAIAGYIGLEPDWWPVAGLCILVALSAWARRTRDGFLFQGSLFGCPVVALSWIMAQTRHTEIMGAVLLSGPFPPLQTVLLLLAAPTLLLGGMAWYHRTRQSDIPLRWITLGMGLTLPLAMAPITWHTSATLACAVALGLFAKQRADQSPNRFWSDASIATLGLAGLLWTARMPQVPQVVASLLTDGAAPQPLSIAAYLLVPALLIAALVWCHRGKVFEKPLCSLAIIAALATPLALVPLAWHAPVLLVGAIALGAWAKLRAEENEKSYWFNASLITAFAAAIFWAGGIQLYPALFASVFVSGTTPPLAIVAAFLGIPSLLLAALAWCHVDRFADKPLRWQAMGLFLATLLALVPATWHPAVLALVAASAILIGTRLPLPRLGHEALLIVVGVALLAPIQPWLLIFARSLGGEIDHFAYLPTLIVTLIKIALPATILAIALWKPSYALPTRLIQLTAAVIGACSLATLYTLIKQPLAVTAENFLQWGLIERVAISQALFIAALLIQLYGGRFSRAAIVIWSVALWRVVWFDVILFNPLMVSQNVGSLPLFNAVVIHGALVTVWLWFFPPRSVLNPHQRWFRYLALSTMMITVMLAVRQAYQGDLLTMQILPRGENYSYSAALLVLSLIWIWQGMLRQLGWLRIAGLGLLTLVTIKVFLIDAAALEGLLRVLSFLGLGGALIGIGWAYGRLLGTAKAADNV